MQDDATDNADAGRDVGSAPGGPATQVDPESAVNTDLTSAVGAEDVDEDRLGVDPLEKGVEPPEDWSAADREGVTAREQAEGETLEHRLWSERPDADEQASTEREREEPTGPEIADGPIAEADAPAPVGTGASTGEPGRDDRKAAPAETYATPSEPAGLDARPAQEDVPTASVRIEDRDDPGEEYR
ncbi:hypothetical protein [Tomitella cavernea]|uniref:DUF5709 domain-containing protein n=1 Tax=Tomitella cavernea TaxID=1387982 RepID=A0ABP9CNW7_9ACTN|nr:hypothetical protein [Tomitella cavernea]